MHLPELISDLALILIVAGIATIIFKKIRQPLVLGYIVAGFLTGPHFTLLPTVGDMENIHVWSEIGIICLMFALGLEFSFHKLANVGETAIITSMTEVCGMFLFGFVAGYALGWSVLDSVILGGVLSMSSTTIIIKAFEELGLKGKKFTEIVFGALIVEDIVGIFLMVFMSTFALSRGAGGEGLVITVAQLMFYLVLWLILGIFVIPTLLKKAGDFINDETLLIVSLGICFGMVLLFSYIGFSTALGSFIAGSILAGTVFSEKIEHLLKPIRDLFGAVFFISVGMLVDPAVLLRYAWPIVVITAATILGKLIFSSLGVLLSGQKPNTAVYCGASLAQIGEFSFIIAALGTSLKLCGDFFYPVVVSVSVITTFTTPFFIKNAENIFLFVKKLIPANLYDKIERHTSDSQSEKEKDDCWKKFLKRYFTNIIIRVIIVLGILQLGISVINPFLDHFLNRSGGDLLTVGIVLLLMSPFLGTLLYQHDKNFTMLLIKSQTNRFPLYVFLSLRVVVTVSLVVTTIYRLIDISMLWLIIPAAIFVIVISRSDWIIGKYLQIEARFLANFNEKGLLALEMKDKNGEPHHSWLSDELWVAEYFIDKQCKEVDLPLKDLSWKKTYNVNIIKIVSGKKHMNIPGGNLRFHAGDTIFLLGTKDRIDLFDHAAEKKYSGITRQKNFITLREFIADQDSAHDEKQLFCYTITVNKNMNFKGKSIKESRMRSDWNCNIIGIHRNRYPIVYPDVQFVIKNGDRIWLLGGHKLVERLIMEELIQTVKDDVQYECI